jgi:hypothetical protein
LPNLVCQFETASRNIFEQDPQYETRYRIQIARERVATDPDRFERDCPTTSERINQEWRLTIVGLVNQFPSDVKISVVTRQVPVREVGDEPEQRFSQILIFWTNCPGDCWEQFSCPLLKRFGAALVTWIRPQQCQQYRPAGSQRTTGPPEVNG